MRGDRDAARAAYEQALRLAPDHADARAGLERLATAAPPTRPLDAPYEILLRNPSPASQRAAAALAALSFDLRPTLTASLGRVLLAALPLVLGVALLYLVRQPTAPRLPQPMGVMGLLLVLVGLALVAFVVLGVRAGRIALTGGRLRLTSGLRQQITNVELWRVRDVRLDRSLLNRVTGDGTLVLLINRGPHATPSELRVVGLARGRRLQELFDRISELVDLLRGSVLGPEG
ncbi:MAG: PH domain-containing protein [Chloroflexi bacterium]|nr:PH domain-containing protein [Chloroflexota bacterium]